MEDNERRWRNACNPIYYCLSWNQKCHSQKTRKLLKTSDFNLQNAMAEMKWIVGKSLGEKKIFLECSWFRTSVLKRACLQLKITNHSEWLHLSLLLRAVSTVCITIWECTHRRKLGPNESEQSQVKKISEEKMRKGQEINCDLLQLVSSYVESSRRSAPKTVIVVIKCNKSEMDNGSRPLANHKLYSCHH